MTTPEEDEAWRLIVDHYDETAVRDSRHPAEEGTAPAGDTEARQDEPCDDEGAPRGDAGQGRGSAEETAGPVDLPAPAHPADEPAGPSHTDEAVEPWTDPDDEFVPPPGPPAPDVPTGRRVAWAAVAGVPVVFFGAALTGRTIPGAVAALLAAALAAAFVYLVVSLPREPRDPWDDGSRV